MSNLIISDLSQITDLMGGESSRRSGVDSVSSGGFSDDLFERGVIWQESRGRQFGSDGKPLTSKAGAIGIAQVMPGTAPEAARMAGLEWDENRYRTDESYNKALGKAYFNQQLKEFGDPAMALAAYNAGPGATRRAIRLAERAGRPGQWLDFLPAETRDYVPKILGRMSGEPSQAESLNATRSPRYFDRPGAPAPSDSQVMDGIKDSGLALGSGVVRGVGMIASAFGADNEVARGADEIADNLMDKQSEGRKAERANRAELIRQAEESGSKWEEIKANIGGFLEAPIETSLGAIGTSAPTILMSFIPGLGQANAARLILQGAVGAAQGAGAVKDSIYESVERKLIEDGADPDTAAKVAAGAQAYDSANGGQIALGAILGVAAGTTGIERSVSGILGNTIKSGKQPGVLGRIALGAAKESPVEGIQGGQERYAANQALINEGFQVDPWQGVAGQAAGEFVAAAGPGGLFGALDNSAPVARNADPKSNDPGPLTNAISPELNPSGGGQPGAADASSTDQPVDPVSKRVSEIEQAVRDGGLLEQLRQIGQPGRTAGEFLDALAVAKNPKADPRLRQQAIESLEMAMGWLRDGKMPGAEASGQPFRTDLSVPPTPREPGTDLATQGDREVAPNGMGQFFDPNTVDVDAVRVDNMIGGPRAIDGPRDAIGMDPTLRNQRAETQADPAAEPAAEAGAQVASEGTIVVDADADLREANEAAEQSKSRRKVEFPRTEIPAGTEPAAFRKASAQIQAAVDRGFDVVERRADGQFLVNTATNQEISLSLGDMARARKIISDTINRRANEAASSPLNDLERPTEAQAKAGNYKKGAAKLNGFSIAIENPRGSTRSGTSPDGRKWENTMAHHYGYLKRTEGADGDQVDVFIGPRPDLDTVFVVDQINPRTGRFDEHKVMMGFPDAESARQGYMANYDADWQGFSAITPMSLDQFRKWVLSDAAKMPAASYDPAPVTQGDGDGREGSGDRGAAVDSQVDSDSGREGENDGGITGGRSSGARQLEDAADSRGSGERAASQPDSPDRAGARDRRSVEEILEEARQRINPNIRAADPNSSDTKALNALLNVFARLTGRRAIAISLEGDGAFDGVQFGDVNLINVDRPEVHVATTIAHEFKHLTEHIPSFARVYERIWEMIPESGRREFYESYLARTRDDVPPFFDMATPQAITILKQEMVADFIGKRFNDREWLEQLAAKKPALFGDFVRDWVRVLDEIAQRLKALMGIGGATERLKNVDRYIADLDQAKALAMEAVEMWATKYPRIARERGYVGGEAMFSARDDDFTGMDDFDGFNIDGDFMDGEMERMLQEELAAEMEGANTSPTADAIDPKELKAAGIMAERAFGDLYWEDESGDGWQLIARVPDLYVEGKTARLEIEQNVDGLWRADLTGTWVGPAAAENSGYATEQGVKDFVARHVASVALARSGFDLISAAPKAQIDRATKAWKQLGDLEVGGKSKAFKFGRAGRQAQTLKEIAEGMGILDNYNLSVFVDQMDPTSTIYNMTFTHKESSKSYSAMLELHKVGDKKFFTANTIELGRSGMGAAVYQMAADFAARRGIPLRPESSLSGVNTYRRTEQMISAALRTGKSNAMVPHPTQRIYGFNDKATTEADHTKNISRLLLASLRNVRELAPEVEELLYFPESDTFTFLDGEDAKVLVDEILSRTDARAFGLGRTQLARAAMTQQFMQGEKAPAVDDLSASVLYSARIKDEVEYQAVVDKYKGTDQWLKAPNGLATKLTERQWVQVRTPSFKRWFGDWEKFATMEAGVWNDANNEVSKAVDQQTGEPLVLYHGTTKGGFFRFNGATGTRRGELGTFATPNYEMAASYVRRGRPQDIPMPTDRADLEEIGYQFEEDEDGRIDLIGTDGYVDDTFDTVDEAVDYAIKTFQGSSDTPTIYALFANVRNVSEEDFKGAMWTGDFEGDKFEVYDSNGDIAYTEDGRDVMDRDEAVALAERVGGSFEPASPLPFNTDDVARDALLNKQDGAIIRNVIDDGGGAGGYYGEPSDVFVIFDGANVKSAEFNSGEFDDGDDIRYSGRAPRLNEIIGDFRGRTQKDGTLVVAGDPVQIRSLLPDGVKGRPVNGGLLFSTSDAPRARAALEGRKLTYSRAGAILDRKPMKDGKYVGAPEKFNTPSKIPTLRRWLKQLTKEGEPGRHWYENSSREILRMVGGNVQEARKFVALLAIYSPQAKVDANSTFALRAWAQYKAGQPINVKTGVMDRKAQAALDDIDAFWSGEKTGNFFFNLLREIDPSTAGKQGATIDMWMMRAGQYSNDAPTATQYAFMEDETNRLAADFGWEPQQIQAAIWVAMKARMENPGVKKATEETSEKRGWIRFDVGTKGQKQRVILNAQKHRDNWLKHAFAHDPSRGDTEQAKFDFSDGVMRHVGQISFEARPGRTTGVLPGIHSAPYEQQVEFQQAVHKAFHDDRGVDMLAMRLGLLVDSDILVPGVWQGEVSPSTQTIVSLAPAKGGDGKTKVDPAQAKLLNVYASVAGLLARQEGVGWHKPFYTANKRDSNALDIDIGRPLTPEEAIAIESAVGRWMGDAGKPDWQNGFAFISSPKGIRLVNFGVIGNPELHSDIVRVIERVLPDFDYRLFASDGDMPTNDWKENPDGQGYIQRIRAEGRSDVLDWAATVLAPRIQSVFEDFSARYGWGKPGLAPGLEEIGSAKRRTPKADVRFSARAPGELFYSELKRQIDGASMKQAAPGAWKQFIKALSGKGVKADEIEWTGINEWLDLQEGKVTRQQISDYLGANGVQVQEVVLGRTGLDYSGDLSVGPASDYSDEWGIFDEEGRIIGGTYETEDLAIEAMDQMHQDLPSKYGQYTLPGGQNYREVLLTLPDARDSINRKLGEANNAYMDAVDEYGATSDEAKAAKQVRDRLSIEMDAQPNYRSSHWDQPNVFAHIRLNDRTDTQGRKVLFVEEIQSDWGQDTKRQRDEIAKAVEDDFQGIVDRMKKAGLLQVDCD